MKRNPIDLFNEWAKAGKDERMAKTHEPSVVKMLDYIYKIYDRNYTFIDAGCGNGWVVKNIITKKLHRGYWCRWVKENDSKSAIKRS